MKTAPQIRQSRQVKQKLLHFRLMLQRLPYLTPSGIAEARALISALIAQAYLRDKTRLHAMIDEYRRAQHARLDELSPLPPDPELSAHYRKAIDLLSDTLKWILDDSLFLPFPFGAR